MIAATIVVAVLILGIAGTTLGMLRAVSAERGMQRELTRATEVKGIITEMLGSIDPLIAQGQDNTLLKAILDDTAQRLLQGEITDELIAAELHHVIGVAYRAIGSPDQAEQHIPVALETRTRLLGEDDPSTLMSAHEQVHLYGFQRRFAELEPLALRTLERRERVLGPEHPDTLRSMEAWGYFLILFKRLDEAEEVIGRTLEVRTRVLGPEHRDTLLSRSRLGLLYFDQGRLQDAEPILRDVLAARKRVLGEAHPDVFHSMRDVIRLYEQRGRYEDVIPLWAEMLDSMRHVLGDEHPHTLRAMYMMCSHLARAERFDELCAAREMELAARRIAQGARHQQTLRTIRDLGTAYARVGRHEDALTLYRETLASLPAEPDAADASRWDLFTVGWILTRDLEGVQDPARAVAFARRAVEVAKAEGAAGDGMLDLLARAQYQSGDVAEAVETQKQAIAAAPRGRGPAVAARYEASLDRYRAAMNGSIDGSDNAGDPDP